VSTKALWKALETAFEHPNADGETVRAARAELEGLDVQLRQAFIQGLREAASIVAERGDEWCRACEIYDRLQAQVLFEDGRE